MDGEIVIGTKIDLAGLKKQLKQAEIEIERLEKAKTTTEQMSYYKGQEKDLKEINSELKKAINNYNKIDKQINKIATGNVKNLKNSLGDIVKSVTRWGLAIFGIRSAYSAVRSAMSTLSQYDETMASNIEYIRYVLANSLKPVVEYLINLAYKLLVYTNYILKSWSGIDLFAGATADSFAKAKDNLKGATKEAKELSKQLAGFDEMNILQENGSTSRGGGGGGTAIPNLPTPEDVPIPKWVKWIADNKTTILTVLGALGTAFAVSKVKGWLNNLGLLFGSKDGVGLNGILGKLGEIALIGGSLYITGKIAAEFWNDLKNLRGELQEITEVNSKANREWITQEKEFENLSNTANVNRAAGYELLKKTGGVWNLLNGLGQQNLETVKQTAITTSANLKKQIELYNAGKLENEEKEKLLEQLEEQLKFNKAVSDELSNQNQDNSEILALQDELKENYSIISEEVTGTRKTLDGINDMDLKDKDLTIDVDADTTKAEHGISGFFSRIQQWFKNNIAPAFEALGRGLGFGVSENYGGGGGGGRGFAKGGIVKLAKGGIVNKPGRGVPIASGFMGERGMEGIVPLTDSQQMELLGEAIGRYITINANITNSMNGRIISRELQRIQNDSNFSFNR